MDKIKEAEEYAGKAVMQDAGAIDTESEFDFYRAGLQVGYLAGAAKYEALYREAVEALEKMLKPYNSPRLTSYEMITADTAALIIITKSKTILND